MDKEYKVTPNGPLDPGRPNEPLNPGRTKRPLDRAMDCLERADLYYGAYSKETLLLRAIAEALIAIAAEVGH